MSEYGNKLHEQLKYAAEIIQSADAVLIGGGSGISSAAGYNHYHHNKIFIEHFSDFENAYGIQNLFQGFYYVYSTPEQQWGFYSRYIQFMYEMPVGNPYIKLKELLKDKDYFILTTNADIQFPRAFPEERLFQFQGDFLYFQCCQPCHDKLYDNRELIKTMLSHMNNLQVPEPYIPRCPECGWRMIPWVRDNTFLTGNDWNAGHERYVAFLKKYRDKKIVLLELGVGEMTPSIIKFPFWEITADNQEAFLIMVNQNKNSRPEQLGNKAMAIAMDIGEFLSEIGGFIR